MKIRKSEYRNISKYFDFGTDLFIYPILLEMEDRKSILKIKYENSKNYLEKNRYVEPIKKLNNSLTLKQIKDLLKEMDNRYIKMFRLYYDNFISLFIELDKNIKQETVNRIIEENYKKKYFPIDHFFLGMYIRNEYIFKKNDNVNVIFSKEKYYFDDDSKSTIIIFGYRYYKLGIFNIFEEKWYCA
jgi:hypothetical protein